MKKNDFGYKLSLIIPVYNAEKYIERTLSQILAQTIFSAIEVIVVNDGSIDDSQSICKRYSEQYANIRLIAQSNQGVSAARNNGFRHSTGSYVVFIDSDDQIEPDLCEKMLALAEKNEADIGIVNFEKKFEDDTGYRYYKKNSHFILTGPESLSFFFSGKISNQIFDKIFRREVIENVDFPVGYKIGEDMFYVYQALTKATKIAVDYRITGYHYAIHTGSAMTQKFGKKHFDSVKLCELIYHDVKDNEKLEKYAMAHLIHEKCKLMEYIYRSNAQGEYRSELESLHHSLLQYSTVKAFRYLTKKQFCGYILMKYSPKLYMKIHQLLRIS